MQLSITLARNDNCPSFMPTVILGELFDCRTLQECELLFSFIDNNVKIWKEEFFFKNVRNHLLRICNDLLRRLSRNQNTVFCGRIMIFLANFFPLFERSGLNLTSEFNQENSGYALQADGELSEKSDKEDDQKIDINFKIDYNFYKKFWQLQEYFRNPTICYSKSNFKGLQLYCNEVLSVFSGYKIDPNSSFYFQTLGLDSSDDKNIFFVKYLTNQKLLELQLSDSNFRRHILIQILILFQYFSTNVKFRSDGATFTEEQTNWINDTRKKANHLIEETPPNGEEVRKVLEHLFKREEYWNTWKNDGCGELKEPSESEEQRKLNTEYIRASYHVHKRARLGDYIKAANNSNRISIGNSEMNRLWNFCPDNIEACKSQKRVYMPSIENYFEQMLKRPTDVQLKDCSESFRWKALRLLSQKSHYFFVPNNQVVKPVNDYLQGVIDRLAEEYNQVSSKSNDISDETKAETEDISDDELLKNVETSSVKSTEEDTLDAPDTNDSNTNESALPDDVITEAIIIQIASKTKDHWDELSPLFGFMVCFCENIYCFN